MHEIPYMRDIDIKRPEVSTLNPSRLSRIVRESDPAFGWPSMAWKEMQLPTVIRDWSYVV